MPIKAQRARALRERRRRGHAERPLVGRHRPTMDSGGSYSTPERGRLRRGLLQHERHPLDRRGQQLLRHRRRLPRRRQEDERRPLLAHDEVPAGRLRGQGPAPRPRTRSGSCGPAPRTRVLEHLDHARRLRRPQRLPARRPDDLGGRPGPAASSSAGPRAPESDVSGYRVYRARGHGPLTAVTTAQPVTTPTTSTTACSRARPTATRSPRSTRAATSPPARPIVTATVPMKALPAGTYEDDDTDDVTLKGSWTPDGLDGAGTDSGGSFSSLGADGYAEMSFATSGIRWLARTNSSSGQRRRLHRRRQADHRRPLLRRPRSSPRTSSRSTGLPETGHTIRIVRTGNKNAASAGPQHHPRRVRRPRRLRPGRPDRAQGHRDPHRRQADLDEEPGRATSRPTGCFRRADGSTDRRPRRDDRPPTPPRSPTSAWPTGASYTWTVVARDT